MDATEKLLKELSEAPGVSGFEVEIRKALRRHLEPLAAIEGDRLGSLIARKEGSSAAPKVMVAAHMDEIGFMVKQITGEGFIQLPNVTIQRLETTVSVPDGGTLLLGGQRISGEVEREIGVPLLNKIPILNRLFSNRGIIRDERTLLILIRPKIIIQREEEERQYPD